MDHEELCGVDYGGAVDAMKVGRLMRMGVKMDVVLGGAVTAMFSRFRPRHFVRKTCVAFPTGKPRITVYGSTLCV